MSPFTMRRYALTAAVILALLGGAVHSTSEAANGHGDCLCAPEFRLVVTGNEGRLTVEGTSYRLVRPTPDGTWTLA